MAKAGRKSRGAWLNPKMLEWAREWRGRSVEAAAKKVNQTPERILEWERGERGDAVPTVRQARTLAAFYGRPFVELFLDERPPVPEPEKIADFRTHAGVEAADRHWEVINAQRWAESIRDSYIFLCDELNYPIPKLPKEMVASLSDDVEGAALKARRLMKFTIHDQLRIRKSDIGGLPDIFRKKLERIGILVLKRTDLAKYGVRGLCVFNETLPIIVFTAEAPTAQSFTIAHELAHVMAQQSGVSGFRSRNNLKNTVEKWCDRFAGAFLMPKEQILALVGAPPARPAKSIADHLLYQYADTFRVSPHAMLIRLVDLGYVRRSYYWAVKYPRFKEEEENYSGFGRPAYYGTRYENAVGEGYTRLVLEAWASGNITNHNAAEFMGIKNLEHLYDIRRAAEAA